MNFRLFQHRPRATVSGCLLGMLWLAVWGCNWNKPRYEFYEGEMAAYQHAATEIEAPAVVDNDRFAQAATAPPRTLLTEAPPEYWDLHLDECIQIALANSRVLRDLGGVLRTPESLRTIQGPAIQETDPRFGVEAALSLFDASFSTNTFFEKNDRALNNTFLGGGTRLLTQDVIAMNAEISKTSATGTQFALRQDTDYDANNAPGNFFPSAWTVIVEGEVRQPLMQGAGLNFNRIAGPGATPGVFRGVLVARVNNDITLAEFQEGVRNLVSNVENTYWDLVFAYRDLQAKVAARDAALDTWRAVDALYVAGKRGGEAEKEAQAREQYFRFEEEVQNALTGPLFEGTRTNNGTSGGTFRGTVGVQAAERRLRLLMGVPINDGRLIRPVDEPPMARVVFDWEEVLLESLARRVELRRQRWAIKLRELELSASRNYLYPQLDAVGRYRWRGFGKDLIDPHRGGGEFDNAFKNLTSGDFQEWTLGFEMNLPFGYRQAHAAVRNSQLLLAREQTILREQERDVVLGLSNAVTDVTRAYVVAQTAFNRRLAAKEQLAALETQFANDKASLDLVLEAQRRLADAEARFHRALVEYAIAIKNVHFEKGSLLDYNEVYLAEGPWPNKAYEDAARREHWRGPPRRLLNYIMHRPAPVSAGIEPQQLALPHGVEVVPVGQEPSTEVVPPPLDDDGLNDGLNDGGLRDEVLPPPTQDELLLPQPPRTLQPSGFPEGLRQVPAEQLPPMNGQAYPNSGQLREPMEASPVLESNPNVDPVASLLSKPQALGPVPESKPEAISESAAKSTTRLSIPSPQQVQAPALRRAPVVQPPIQNEMKYEKTARTPVVHAVPSPVSNEPAAEINLGTLPVGGQGSSMQVTYPTTSNATRAVQQPQSLPQPPASPSVQPPVGVEYPETSGRAIPPEMWMSPPAQPSALQRTSVPAPSAGQYSGPRYPAPSASSLPSYPSSSSSASDTGSVPPAANLPVPSSIGEIGLPKILRPETPWSSSQSSGLLERQHTVRSVPASVPQPPQPSLQGSAIPRPPGQ